MKGVEITWAGGAHEFALPIDLLRAVQDRCDAGPAWILSRLSSGQWRIDDILSVIRFGLEGGGMDKAAAIKLVKLHVEDRPLTESVLTAQAVLMSALYGGEEEADAGEQKGQEA